ncbi:MAG: hypothetical protein E6R13_08775 [Spirochaetes bacterium]|nr:MAG: hypothetical protein E6R13_08775 [Spirochaetota bacterium]
MKEEILKLREEGKSYNEIKELLGCSKSTISYHCGVGQKEKTVKRQNKRRENIIISKTEAFKNRKKKDIDFTINKIKTKKNFVEIVRKFQKRDVNYSEKYNKDIVKTFDWTDVVEKYGEDTICYLSGEKINLFENTYHFDHIIPSSKGGDNSLDNLGIAYNIVNKMKNDLTPDELIEWCIKILKHNGYQVTK